MPCQRVERRFQVNFSKPRPENIKTGKARAPIVMNDFGAYDLAAQGKVILQAGITGPYTGNDGTAATLSKHTLN